MIHLFPTAGLCNRMRAIDSAIALSRQKNLKLKVYWEPYLYLNSPFDLLFESIDEFELIPVKPNALNPLNTNISDLYNSDVFVFNDNTKALDTSMLKNIGEDKDAFFDSLFLDYKNLVIESFERFYPNDKKYEEFKPIKSLQKKIDNISESFDPNTIGIHVRRTDNIKAIQESPLYVFVSKIESEIESNPDSNFYLASDDLSVKSYLQQRFGERIKTNLNQATRTTIEGMQDAVIELYVLANTSKILGSYWSTYSRTSADIKGIPYIVVKN